MSFTYTEIVYQIVFATKDRQPSLPKAGRPDLYAYITQTLKNKSCYVYTVNGVEDHVHVIFSLHPAAALADVVKTIKLSSAKFLASHPDRYPDFAGWQRGYAAFTYPQKDLPRLITHVNNQEERHLKMTSKQELRLLLKQHNIEIDERYFE